MPLPSSVTYRNDGDCNIALTTAWIPSANVPPVAAVLFALVMGGCAAEKHPEAQRGVGDFFAGDYRHAREVLRPLASKRVSLRSAWLLVGSLCLLGLVILAQLKWVAALAAVASIAPVAAYPFMKRITWWPQAWPWDCVR